MNANRKVSARKVAVLYLLDGPSAAGSPAASIEGTTKLQKLLFLLQERYGESLDRNIWNVDFSYEPEKFGPADLGLYQDLEFLVAAGHIRAGHIPAPSNEPSLEMLQEETQGQPAIPEEQAEQELSFEYLMGTSAEDVLQQEAAVQKVYSITDQGRHLLHRLEANQFQASELTKLREACAVIKRQYAGWPLKKLLEYVYRNYESMTTASTIRDRVLRQR
jgi:hypothetical protein